MADVDGGARVSSSGNLGGSNSSNDASHRVARNGEFGGSNSNYAGIFHGLGLGPAVPPPVVDTTPPVVSNYSPLPGTSLSSTDSISFDVTDDSGAFHCLFVVARFNSTGDRDVVHVGVSFSPKYVATSSRAAITDGFRYTVRKAGGWPASPTFEVFAVDAGGNEAS